MTDLAFPHLLAPGRIGPMDLRNRILLSPMGDRLAHDDGTVSEREAAYLEARARGGAGLVMIGSVAVAYPEGAYATCQTALSDDRFVPGLRDLTERIHRHGAKIGVQLVHDGANSLLDIEEGRPVLVPSAPPRLRRDPLSAMVTADELAAMRRPFTAPTSTTGHRIADEDDIVGVIAAFAASAGRAAEAGVDGVEIHAGHGYLIDSFLSAAANHRDDRWGGDVVGRARLLTEVLAAVRSRVGDRLAVWCRLNAVERYREGGETPDDLLQVADLAVSAGADAIHVSAATDAGAALGVTEAHTPHEPALLVPFAASVRARVDVPVITVGRLEPEVAEAVLARGDADFVAMGRKLLADPDLPRKLAEGRVREVRPCIYQYRCIGNIFLNEPVSCVANPATAHGDEVQLPPTAAPRRVLVVGGGPAGLESARLLARRGHAVTLAEATSVLGGTLRLAGTTDEVLARFVDWQVAQVEAAPVDLRLGVTVTPGVIAELEVDEVVVATGGVWTDLSRSGVEVADGADVRTVAQIELWLRGDPGAVDPIGDDVVVVGGGKAGMSTAWHLARAGHAVTVLEPSGVLAPELGAPGRFRLVHDVEAAGARLAVDAHVEAITATGVRWVDGSGATNATGASTVLTTDRVPDPAAVHVLADARRPVHVVGDASRIAGVEGALQAARDLALVLG